MRASDWYFLGWIVFTVSGLVCYAFTGTNDVLFGGFLLGVLSQTWATNLRIKEGDSDASN